MHSCRYNSDIRHHVQNTIILLCNISVEIDRYKRVFKRCYYELQKCINVLVGIDGSRQAKFAFSKATEIAKKNNANLYLLSVTNGQKFPDSTPKGYGFADNSIYQPAVDEMEQQLAELKQIAEDSGVNKITTDVLIGNSKEELAVNYPEKHKIDMLVVGATGLNSISRLIVGSTASYCVRVAPCDVTVVKTDNSNKPIDIKKSIHR